MAAKSVDVRRIISGGQTGADRGGLLAAQDLGIARGGTAPQGWWTETGSEEQLLRNFGLIECSDPGYEARTKKNVLDADGTVIFGGYTSGGSALTANFANDTGKPFFHVPFPRAASDKDLERISAEFRGWLDRFQIQVLNVAGNRESQNPGAQQFTRKFLVSALQANSL